MSEKTKENDPSLPPMCTSQGIFTPLCTPYVYTYIYYQGVRNYMLILLTRLDHTHILRSERAIVLCFRSGSEIWAWLKVICRTGGNARQGVRQFGWRYHQFCSDGVLI